EEEAVTAKGVRVRGVRQRPWGRWAAEIRDPQRGRRVCLGTFNTVEEAAAAFNTACLRIRGPGASTNLPPPPSAGDTGPLPPHAASPLPPRPPLPPPAPRTLGHRAARRSEEGRQQRSSRITGWGLAAATKGPAAEVGRGGGGGSARGGGGRGSHGEGRPRRGACEVGRRWRRRRGATREVGPAVAMRGGERDARIGASIGPLDRAKTGCAAG
ncbi:hypothetical protein BAE44_0001437, partial [Dichanthelium oligosanthes]